MLTGAASNWWCRMVWRAGEVDLGLFNQPSYMLAHDEHAAQGCNMLQFHAQMHSCNGVACCATASACALWGLNCSTASKLRAMGLHILILVRCISVQVDVRI
jgi:hypothetical protein